MDPNKEATSNPIIQLFAKRVLSDTRRWKRMLSGFYRYQKLSEDCCPMSFENPNYIESADERPFKDCHSPGDDCTLCATAWHTTQTPKKYFKSLYRTVKKRVSLLMDGGNLFRSLDDLDMHLIDEDTLADMSLDAACAPSPSNGLLAEPYDVIPSDSRRVSFPQNAHMEVATLDAVTFLRRLMKECERNGEETGLDDETSSNSSSESEDDDGVFVKAFLAFGDLDKDKSWLKLLWDKHKAQCFVVILDLKAASLSKEEASKVLSLPRDVFQRVMRNIVRELSRRYDQTKSGQVETKNGWNT